MPVILRATNEDWKQAAAELIEHAGVLVLDVSEGSGAIRSEIEMIDAADRWSDVVVLAREPKPGTEAAAKLGEFAARGAEVVPCKKSWLRALPRLFVGSIATILVTVPLFYLLPLLAKLLLSTGFPGAAGSAPVTPADLQSLDLFSFSSTYVFVVNVIIGGWICAVFFVRPALNRGAMKTLPGILRQD